MTRMCAAGFSSSLSTYLAAALRNDHATPVIASSHKTVLFIASKQREREREIGLEARIHNRLFQ
jgi:hypothetical protein